MHKLVFKTIWKHRLKSNNQVYALRHRLKSENNYLLYGLKTQLGIQSIIHYMIYRHRLKYNQSSLECFKDTGWYSKQPCVVSLKGIGLHSKQSSVVCLKSQVWIKNNHLLQGFKWTGSNQNQSYIVSFKGECRHSKQTSVLCSKAQDGIQNNHPL